MYSSHVDIESLPDILVEVVNAAKLHCHRSIQNTYENMMQLRNKLDTNNQPNLRTHIYIVGKKTVSQIYIISASTGPIGEAHFS